MQDLAVDHRRLVGQELGSGRGDAGIAHVGLVDGDGCRLHGAAGQLGPHRHVGAQVLHRLEPADRPSELAAVLGVLDGQLGGPRRQADLERRREHHAVPPPPCGDVRPGDRCALRQPGCRPHRGEGIHGPGQPGGVDGPRVEASTPSSDSTNSTSRSSRRSMTWAGRRLPPCARTGRLDQADHHRPVVGAVDQPGGQVEATRGPGIRARPSSSKTRAASARPRPTPPAASARHRLNTPASPRARQPRSVDDPVAALDRAQSSSGTGPRKRRTPRPARSGTRWARSPRARPSPLAAEPGPPDAHGQVGSLGRPRMRSPTMFRWICEVPAAMVREMPRSQSSTIVSAGREPAVEPVERRRRRGRPARAGTARTHRAVRVSE